MAAYRARTSNRGKLHIEAKSCGEFATVHSFRNKLYETVGGCKSNDHQICLVRRNPATSPIITDSIVTKDGTKLSRYSPTHPGWKLAFPALYPFAEHPPLAIGIKYDTTGFNMVILWLPSLLLSIGLSIGLTLLLNAMRK